MNRIIVLIIIDIYIQKVKTNSVKYENRYKKIRTESVLKYVYPLQELTWLSTVGIIAIKTRNNEYIQNYILLSTA